MLKKKLKVSDLVDVELVALIVTTVLMQLTSIVLISQVIKTVLN
jgi:hypothetical protein